VPGDHYFVIGQDPVTHQSHVLESWNGAKIYAHQQIEEELYDYGKTFSLKNGKPHIKKCDPSTQKIQVSAYSIYPLEAFKDNSITQDSNLIQLLREFHQISGLQRQIKMKKAVEIIYFIETQMPLHPYIDPAVHELYDQMLYLTKKERKQGLKYDPPACAGRCLVNEALQNLDLPALRKHLRENKAMDSLTLLHAIKASLRADDLKFLTLVVDAGVPIEKNGFMDHFHEDPQQAITRIAVKLSAENGSLDLTGDLAKALSQQQETSSRSSSSSRNAQQSDNTKSYDEDAGGTVNPEEDSLSYFFAD